MGTITIGGIVENSTKRFETTRTETNFVEVTK